MSCHCTHSTESILIKFELLKIICYPMVIAARHRWRVRTYDRSKGCCRMMMNSFDVVVMMMICTGNCAWRWSSNRTGVIVCRCWLELSLSSQQCPICAMDTHVSIQIARLWKSKIQKREIFTKENGKAYGKYCLSKHNLHW